MQLFFGLLFSSFFAQGAEPFERIQKEINLKKLFDNNQGGNSQGGNSQGGNSQGGNSQGNNIPNFLAPDLTGFNWSAGGQYVAQGQAWFNTEWPVETAAQGPLNATLAIDPVAGIANIFFPPLGAQYVTPHGFFFIDQFGVCYTKPAGDNFTTYANEYRQMRNFAVHFDPLLAQVIKSWGGSVLDPAFGGEYGAVMAQTDAKGRVTTYAFAQTFVLPLTYTGGFGPFNSKVFGSFVFSQWTQGPAPSQYVTLPPACAPGVVGNYTDVFYKPGVYFNPYPV